MKITTLLGSTVAACALLAGAPGLAAAATTPQQATPFEYTVTVHGATQPVSGSVNDRFVSFSAPVEIPGVALEPGTYIFRFVTPKIVQVLSEDRSTIYGIFFTTPAGRTTNVSRSEMTFASQTNGSPARIAAWYIDGSTEGIAPQYNVG